MKIYTSYFYAVRFLSPNQIPLSTAVWDPKWFHDGMGQGHVFVDKRGVVNGLRAEKLHPGAGCAGLCRGLESCECGDPSKCAFLRAYREQLAAVDKAAFIASLSELGSRLKARLGFGGEPEFVLTVHEPPYKECSERGALQEAFGCGELDFGRKPRTGRRIIKTQGGKTA